MRILIVFATSSEAQILEKIKDGADSADSFFFSSLAINSLVTGVGGISTAWAMKQWLSMNPYPDLAINAGIAGSFTDRLKTGDVVIPLSDCFADLGIEADGKVLTLFEAGLCDPGFPFSEGIIHCDNEYVRKAGTTALKVKAVTVNTCSGSASTIERLKNKFNPDIETMEGATFFYICAREKIPFLSVRSISNKIEPGKRDSWDIPLALGNLAEKLKEILYLILD